MWGELSSEWGELSSECGASCLGASFLWGELSWGELSLGRVVRNPNCQGSNCPSLPGLTHWVNPGLPGLGFKPYFGKVGNTGE